MTTEKKDPKTKQVLSYATMSKMTVAMMVSMLGVLAGCGGRANTDSGTTEGGSVVESSPTTTSETVVVDLPTTNVPVSIYADKVISDPEAASLVGMKEADALREVQARGWRVRIVGRDGELYAVTMDYSAGRLNFTIVNGVVSASTVG